MMDDPQNRACIDRETIRRGKPLQYLCPPAPKLDGGVVLPTFRYVSRMGMPSPSDTVDDADAEIFTDGTAWFATLVYDGGSEFGPFVSKAVAIKAVQNYFVSQGFVLLSEVPWNFEDASEWRIRT